ncbi:efflux transporter outer membrane subunit [Tunturiibacter gelidoferens]|uniref:Multidrug efflux system outer membrane protein n=1 Tax=Tunturiibacter lichenicola TaxID=2051959 RepID=A0A7Y9T274_9BACT|nr:efflux transporter outer membrane subunit [Edaphobacter lichenicola]NYF51313.1 multidrug efflux system outer membrane protein [Edaphobacter lichenicola]
MRKLRHRHMDVSRLTSFALTAALTVMISGCMVGPNYHVPSAPVPPAFNGSTTGTSSETVPPAAISYSDWWKVFHDPVLDDFEIQGDSANRDIKIAIAHVDEATALTSSARSYLFPTVGAAPGVSRTREAQNRPNNGNTNGHAATYNDIVLPLVASYEVDAWGRLRRSLQAARATQQASEADLRFVRLETETTIAIDYYSLRESDQELRILDRTLADLQQGFDLTTSRFQHGLSSDLEVAQAKTLLDQTAAEKQALEIQRAQLEHALAVLLGRTVESLSVPILPDNPTPPETPVGLPADLLTRRPDIAESDRNVAAATARIGVAKAAYFPQISLTGLVGYESTNAVSLLNWQNTIASLAASATAPIFTGGRLRAGVDQAQAAYRESLAQYEKTVLVSYQEVEDQLSALQYLSNQSRSQALAVADSERTEQIAMQRYKAGLVSYLDVVIAQQSVLSNERTSSQIAGQRMTASVVLIKSLGGGWTGSRTP